MYYDVHAHLDLYKDRISVFQRIEHQRINIISMTNLPELYERYSNEYKSLNYIRFALGLHPELAFEYHNQLPIFLSLLPNVHYVGEVGLDYSPKRSVEDRNIQRQVFEEIIDCCKKQDKPKVISIHSRAAANDVIDIVGKYHGQIILHWLSDRNSKIDTAIENGYYFSINGEMTHHKNGQALIRKMPISRVLIESDAPFTKGNETAYSIEQLDRTIVQLAEIFTMPIEHMHAILNDNFKNCFYGFK